MNLAPVTITVDMQTVPLDPSPDMGAAQRLASHYYRDGFIDGLASYAREMKHSVLFSHNQTMRKLREEFHNRKPQVPEQHQPGSPENPGVLFGGDFIIERGET